MIVISEDVWGAPFEALAGEVEILRMEDGWQDRDLLKKALADAVGLVVRNRTQVDADLLDAAPRLRVIARAGVGLDNIDIAQADARGIAVVAGLGANAVSVGEMTLGLALAVLRTIPRHDRATRDGEWNRTSGHEISGKTWGLVGCGATGLATARLLSGFGVRILGYDPFVAADDPRVLDFGIEVADLDSVLANSDIISIHAPATAETRGLIDAERISTMRDGVTIVNVGRGELIVEADLVDALKSGKVRGAGLDVRASEPPIVGELEALPNVVLAPHVAGITIESQLRIAEILTANLRAALAGASLTHAVGKVR
jgi:D-3-phosphoglycerate dehydrogenase/(S)-sulfolactate dehydrogenase